MQRPAMGRQSREVKIGQWYAVEHSDRFKVVAVDDANRSIEIQYFDGTLEDISYATWSQLETRDSAPPDNDCGALDTEPPDQDAQQILHGATLTGSCDESSTDIEQISMQDTLL